MSVYLHVCICITYMSDARGGQKKASDSLGTGVPDGCACHLGAGNQTLVLCESSKCSELPAFISHMPGSCSATGLQPQPLCAF